MGEQLHFEMDGKAKCFSMKDIREWFDWQDKYGGQGDVPPPNTPGISAKAFAMGMYLLGERTGMADADIEVPLDMIKEVRSILPPSYYDLLLQLCLLGFSQGQKKMRNEYKELIDLAAPQIKSLREENGALDERLKEIDRINRLIPRIKTYEPPPMGWKYGQRVYSHIEALLAEECEKQKIFYALNPLVRCGDDQMGRRSKRPDILFYVSGNLAIMEADGRGAHDGRADEDHERDKFFMRHAIPVFHFSERRIREDPSGCVEEATISARAFSR